MNWRGLGKTTYNLIGRVLGFGLISISLTGLGLPIYLRLPTYTQTVLGIIYLIISVLVVLLNSFLVCRGKRVGRRISIIPIVFTLTAIPAFSLLVPSKGIWTWGVVLLIIVFDFLGQPLLPGLLCKRFRVENPLRIDDKIL